MNDPMLRPEERRCSICGKIIQARNKYGICRGGTPECDRMRSELLRRSKGIKPRGTNRKTCIIQECPKPQAGMGGYCDMHAHRVRATGEAGQAEPLYRPRIVHVGDVFRMWTALEGYTTGAETMRILCRCECGTERRVLVDALLYGHAKSCGCIRSGRPRKLPDLPPYMVAGEVYGMLTVLEDCARGADLALVRCECGTETKKRGFTLKRGGTRSCGCLRSRRTHGLSGHPLYHLWRGIVARTSNPQSRQYPSYGGRGIRLYEGWQGMPDGFLRFAEYVGERPSPEHSLDRINNDGSYEPGNVRWATWGEQSGNKRKVDELTRERDELRLRLQEAERALAAVAAGTLF